MQFRNIEAFPFINPLTSEAGAVHRESRKANRLHQQDTRCVLGEPHRPGDGGLFRGAFRI